MVEFEALRAPTSSEWLGATVETFLSCVASETVEVNTDFPSSAIGYRSFIHINGFPESQSSSGSYFNQSSNNVS